MAKSKQQKVEMIEKYTSTLKNSIGIIVISPNGITPNAINEFKQKLEAVGSNYNVVKNRLFKLALEKADWPEVETFNAGPNAVIFTDTDIASAAKELKEFIKENEEKIEIRAGVLEGQILDASQVQDLADMPSKEQSIAMIAGLLTQPMSGVVNVLEDSVRSIAIIIDQAFDKEKA